MRHSDHIHHGDDHGDGGADSGRHTHPTPAGVQARTPPGGGRIAPAQPASPLQRGKATPPIPPRQEPQHQPTTAHHPHEPWKKRSTRPAPTARAIPKQPPVSSGGPFGELASAAPCGPMQVIAPPRSLRRNPWWRQEERKNPNNEPSATWCVSSQQAATEAALGFHCKPAVLSRFARLKALPNVTGRYGKKTGLSAREAAPAVANPLATRCGCGHSGCAHAVATTHPGPPCPSPAT